MSTTAVFTVDGMSCGHCERTVSAGLAMLPGVTDVSADAPSGRVTVASAQPLDEAVVRGAVDGAGFTFVGRA
ncbi:heavy-metal-associated domain-containing protein [Kitasatospora sp. NPDC091335]|uniref:heavy-metal-associated domain-containing protein n=1 Tax=Streptomycetaceae TaxID=2062 RepID=UPI00166193E8|nr:heavy-metal-associated domain-containing protein [Streptomyces sp. CBMA156]MBD0672045.1 copper-transporting ATPase [Streptomyces sp. CBMA156]MBD0676399.1 copper-transporting ATPase [Streptomyces sp. CBMA156]